MTWTGTRICPVSVGSGQITLSVRTGLVQTALGYTCQYTDSQTGLIYLRARYYDPSTGQFVTRDPIEAITHQAYAYAGDDPINSTDPSGLFCIPLAGCGFSIGFHPIAGLDALVNIGRGASFGLSDDIANWISPGASCTVPDNPLDRTLGAAGVGLVTGGGSAERIISSWLRSPAVEAASEPGLVTQLLEAMGHEIPSVARAAAAKSLGIGLAAYAVSGSTEGSCGCTG